MNDKEFSPAPAEFSPPRPEFSAPPREWAAPGNEISRDDTAPPQKKRRSLPAMLVAGAAAVAIGMSCWGAAVTDNTPRAALTAEQCAYLDAVSEALLEEDIPGLEALALDPMMRQLCEEVIEPYYYDVLLPHDASYSDMVREDELYTYYRDIDYDGKTLGPFREGRSMRDDLLFSVATSNRFQSWGVHWDVYSILPYVSGWVRCDGDGDGLRDFNFERVKEISGAGTGLFGGAGSRYVCKYYYAGYLKGVCRGSLTQECETGDSHKVKEAYANSTVTLRTGDGRYETTFPVVDGHPKPDASNHVEVVENYNENAALLIWHAPSGEDIELQLVNL